MNANSRTIHESVMEDFSIELPPPEGPVVTRIPELLPEQKIRNKDSINLDYVSKPQKF